MVGPGTGIAPFRSYINDFHQLLGNIYLIFGCRNREGDFHFKEEWEKKKELKLFTAFSRDQPHKMWVCFPINCFYPALLFSWKLTKALFIINTRRLGLTLLSTVVTTKTFLFPLWWHTQAVISHYYLIYLNWDSCTVMPSTVWQSD